MISETATNSSSRPVNALRKISPAVNRPSLKRAQSIAFKNLENGSTFLNLLALAEGVMQWEEISLSEMDFTQGRFKIMMMLCAKVDLIYRPSEFAVACGITRATVTGLLDTLAADGYVTRDLDANDRRSFIIKATPAGRAAFDSILPRYEALAKNLTDIFDEEERRQLDRLTAKIQYALTTQEAAVCHSSPA